MSTPAALVKLPCILAVTLGIHTSLTVPGHPSKTELISMSGPRGIMMAIGPTLATVTKAVFWAVGAIETAVIVSRIISISPSHATYGATVLSTLMRNNDRAQDLGLTPLSVAGVGFVVFGAWLRKKCYKAMGHFFTGQLAIRKDHKLITTGPYSVVRHPSYAALLGVYFGIACWFGSRGSWLRESGVMETRTGSIFVYSYGILLVSNLLVGIGRMGREDRELRKVFGEEWDVWAYRVPSRLIPGVY